MFKDRMMAYYLKILENEKSFSRSELMETMKNDGKNISEATFKVELQKLLKEGSIIRVGRNAYCVAKEGVRVYNYAYSDDAKNIAKILKEKFPLLNFTIMDFVQLNEFVNHQLAHNVIFVSVEADLGDFVFDVLKEAYPGKVLINPTPEIYHQYWSDNMIVLGKLTTEAPKGQKASWHTRLEKMLVDIMAEPLLLASISRAEYPHIYEGAFDRYIVDENGLFRYASRRKVTKKIKELIRKETDIVLRTKE